MRWALTSALILCGMLILSPARADAGMHFCNQTSKTVTVAVATVRPHVVVHVWGWWQLQPGACKMPIGGDLDTSGDTHYHYYAFDTSGGSWSGSGAFFYCVDPDDAFDFNDYQSYHCADSLRRNFRFIETDSRTDFTVNLTP